jgi:integrase
LAVGLRRGEALALRWADVDLVDGSISVRHTLHRIEGRLTLSPVKTDDSARVIPITGQLAAVLCAHRAGQREDQHAAGDRWHDRSVVFATRIGTPIEPRNLNRHFQRLCDRAGVRQIRVHDLRRSCATLLYDQGVPIERIQDILGHSSPTITKTIYVDATRKVQQDAVDKLGFLFDE